MKTLIISFSGGRSSAVMTKLCLEGPTPQYDKKIVLFANTGLEHPATLDFVRDCDEHWGFNTVWLEGTYPQLPGIGASHRIVTYETASRDGRPFEDFVKKYGIPHEGYPVCSRGLKRDVISHYLSSRLKLRVRDYDIAIGIRADEFDRISTKDRRNIIYPLYERGFTKGMVDEFMSKAPFDLQIPSEAWGNCVTCWKKSDRKLFSIAREAPEWFEPFRRYEEMYGFRGGVERRFFRQYRSVQTILEQAQQEKGSLVSEFGCDKGCEIFTIDDD